MSLTHENLAKALLTSWYLTENFYMSGTFDGTENDFFNDNLTSSSQKKKKLFWANIPFTKRKACNLAVPTELFATHV